MALTKTEKALRACLTILSAHPEVWREHREELASYQEIISKSAYTLYCVNKVGCGNVLYDAPAGLRTCPQCGRLLSPFN
jgi:hypothetical protein